MGSIGGVLGDAGRGLKDKVGGFMEGFKNLLTPKAKEGGKDEGVIGGALKDKARMAAGMSSDHQTSQLVSQRTRVRVVVS